MSDKAIFLDRDDTLVEDPGYISDPDQVKLIDGVPESLIQLKSLGYKLIVVSNQSGIARGIITEKKLEQIHDRLKQLLAEKNAYLDKIYYCPYHPDGIVPKYRKESNCRKPNPGMLLRAYAEMKIDLEQSWCIGNSSRDIEAGVKAGCKTILIDVPYRAKSKEQGESKSSVSPDYKAVNIKEAVNIIKKYLRTHAAPKQQEQPAPPKTEEPVPQVTETAAEIEPVPTIQEQLTEQTIEIYEQTPEPADEPTINEPNVSEKQPEQEIPETKNPTHKSRQDKTELLLNDIAGQLRKMQREEMFSEFSIMRLVAGIVQILVLFCLLATIWFLMSSENKSESVFTSLGFAIVLQLMALTFYIMHGRK
ncbi:MAG: D-glycero-beta-D-manno-heptose 1,7-bisphosphate 7-phosphatase [Sedimentisphaerales bacterium]|nr:D-glycero-beta-D-manno-heptose 1,7-bisphosphate 7-phosphatase [Sedimentisphaerales bacterium]